MPETIKPGCMRRNANLAIRLPKELASKRMDEYSRAQGSMSEVPASDKTRPDAGGKPAAELLPQVYEELRRVAALKLANEAPNQTLQTTALVHEAWLRISGRDNSHWKNQYHFLAAAAEAMRRILLDNARRKNRLRHGKGLQRVDLDTVDLASQADSETLLKVDEALDKLALEDPTKAELVKLRYFVGLSIPEAAAALGLSESTAKRSWAYARAWLYTELKNAP